MGLCLRRMCSNTPCWGGRVRPDSVAAFNRNQWQPSTGIGGRVRPDSVATFDRNTHHTPEGRDEEIIDTHGYRLPGGVPLPPRVLEVPYQLLLLGVHGDDRLPGLQGRLDLGVDGGKLGIPIRVARALQRLAVGLEAVAKVVE